VEGDSDMEKRIAIIGSGNWGSTIGKIVAQNVSKLATAPSSSAFAKRVNMYVYEEQFEGRKLSETINGTHENPKYLAGIKLPENLHGETSLEKCVADADILFLISPFQFIQRQLEAMRSHVKPGAYAVTLSKGFMFDASRTQLTLISQMTTAILNIPCYAMMGANIAREVAEEHLCETTLGCDNPQHAEELSAILRNDNFLVQTSADIVPVEMLGALKNIYAFGHGILRGIEGVNDCTRVVLTRMSMVEMLLIIKEYCTTNAIPLHDLLSLTLHSCSYPDLFASSSAGRNASMGKLYAEEFFQHGGTYTKSLKQYEEENLNGQKIQGPLTANELWKYVEATGGLAGRYELHQVIQEIACGKARPEQLLEAMRRFKYDDSHII